ncbi:CoA-binding protein [Halovivax limisalsi]|uniref:CoA-binding protein n=1 Tax=Halovivax limisalsi TaxID=1453760 RepID=UPI001FFC76B6|nr:CoA-binding protein [Halovivax limisalsi]
MPTQSDAEMRAVLEHRRIAVVGCSRTPGKAAHDVPAYLERHGYEIVPVNPYADVVIGAEAADSLSAVEGRVEVGCVFRPSDEVAGIVDEAIDRDDVEALWTQLGIRDDAAAERAESAGLTVVQDRCMKVEHGRLTA